ncbi:28773_t:CDS:2 [Dentiscutata erythropus]|uniref:28773_t:CDS:1 n=1 Tax=Dentiscutata erythropus TaxID=1348616 RepID=A0A9N9IJ00_9GLOM|nr:28773_t:CDS:2 [Dentiscutata erythropus]
MNCPDNIEKLKKLIVKTTNYKGIVTKVLEEKPKTLKEEKKIPKQIKIKTEVSPNPIQETKRVYNYKKKEYREQVFSYIKEEEINPENLTDKEITTYLVYSLVTADRSRVKTSLEIISRKSFNRNQLENIFKALKLGDLIIFGKYSGTPKKGNILRGRDYVSIANRANEYRWSTEIMQTVFAIVRTKLRKDALEVFDTEIATINCYFRSNLDNANDLKDAENYPIRGVNYLQAAGAWHASTTAKGTRINPHVTDATQQKGFRDVFDENFTRDSVQSLNQKEFLKFNFYKNLDWSDDSGFRKQVNQYKKLKQLSNWQWAPNFFGGNYMYLVERMPKNIAQQITLTNPVPNNEEDFFRRADTLFRATRITMKISEKSKNEKTNYYSQRTQKINNVQTEQPQKGKCYSYGQIGHFAKECPRRKGKEAYNRVQSTYKNYNGRQKKTFVKKYCSYCGKDNGYHTKTCPNNNANYYEGKRAKGPTPMVHKYNNFKNNKEKGRPRYNNRNNNGRRPQNNTRKSFTRRRVNNYKEEKQSEKERSHGQHTKSNEITQLDTINQPKIYLVKNKSCAASYLARKTSDPGKSEKNLPLAPNVDSKNLSPNNVVKNKLTTYTLSKTSRTSNNQLHVNNNMILEKTIKPNTSKKKKAKPPLKNLNKSFLKKI